MTAAELLLKGFALVPVPRGRKGPVDKGWNDRANVITDPAEAYKLQGLNFGLAHAYCVPSPTCAIDVDDYREACHWLTARSIDLMQLLNADSIIPTVAALRREHSRSSIAVSTAWHLA
jgi:hypothetical protein